MTVGIASALGLQWTLGVVTTVVLWGIGLPALYYFSIYEGGGLDVAWTCIYPPYVAMNAFMLLRFSLTDWNAVSDNVRRREGLEEPLLPEERDDNV